MCYCKRIYGMPFEFFGFQGVETYLQESGGSIETLGNRELDSWFRYLQVPVVIKQVKKVLVINSNDENARQVVTSRGNPNEIMMLQHMTAEENRNSILGQQANDLILINYDKVAEKADSMGQEFFLSVLLHETTHLLEQYLTYNFGIYNKLEADKRAIYAKEVQISEHERQHSEYLSDIAEYQRNFIEEEALTSLVEALTFYHLKAADTNIVGALQRRLHNAIGIAQNQLFQNL